MEASVEARISLIKLEFSSCLFADSPINLLKVSSIDFLRSCQSVRSLSTSSSICSIVPFLRVFYHFLDGLLASAAVLVGTAPLESRIYRIETEEVSNRFVAPCFVNGLEAYDDEINLGVKENMISNEYVVKLCLEHEVKLGNKVVMKELIVSLRDEIYFVKFIINPEEDDVEPGEEGKSNDDWDHLLDINIDDVPLLGEEGLPPFICKMGKSSRNKKRAMENLNFFYQDIGTSSSAGGHLTQEEAAKEAIAIRMS
ncbi:hypothetical protein Tco_0923783 [Tanacetum coccineum]|uniref:Uncharacterized protein n=1 Tax=Tanacetum coccineum TaxID=301880 RepID=A0ABQ5D2V9_9ASTR